MQLSSAQRRNCQKTCFIPCTCLTVISGNRTRPRHSFLPNASGFMGEPIVCASLSQRHRAFHVPHPSAQGRQHLSVKEPEPEEEETTGRERLRPRKGRRAPALGEGHAAHHHTTKKIKGSGPQRARWMCAFAAGKMLQFKNKQSCHRVHKAHSSCCSLLLSSEWARW